MFPFFSSQSCLLLAKKLPFSFLFYFGYCLVSALSCHLTLLILFHVCDELFFLSPLLSQKVFELTLLVLRFFFGTGFFIVAESNWRSSALHACSVADLDPAFTLMRIRIRLVSFFKADPKSYLTLYTDSYLATRIEGMQICNHWPKGPTRIHCEPPRLQDAPSQLSQLATCFSLWCDPDPTFDFDTASDPAFDFDAAPDPQLWLFAQSALFLLDMEPSSHLLITGISLKM